MFKILALCGAIAGGATYGLYAHTDLFNNGCPLSGMKCCQESKPSGDTPEPCCTDSSAGSAPESCCLTKTSTTKPASCCPDLCPDSVKAAAACPACALCCGDTAKTAVAGPMGAFVSAPRK